MKKFAIIIPVLFLFACGPASRENQQKNISDIEKKIHNEKFSEKLAEEFLTATTNYIVSFPKDSMAPVYLFKQADMYLSINKPKDAVSALKKLQDEFPAHRLVGDALLQQAIINDNMLQNKTEAKLLYNKFLTKFPNHKNAAVAHQALQLIDLNPEDLVRKFEAGQDSASNKK